jgi:hypothetical protein
MKEIWKDVAGFEGRYQISNIGRFKSVSRKIWNGHGYFISKEKMLKGWLDSAGYKRINIYKNKIKHVYMLHRLVALNFIENIKEKPDINHKDGNKLNNHVNNLEWVTKSENTIHAWKTGLAKPHEVSVEQRMSCSKLNKKNKYKKKKRYSKKLLNNKNFKAVKRKLKKDSIIYTFNSTRELCDFLKISKSTFYRYLKNKEKYIFYYEIIE